MWETGYPRALGNEDAIKGRGRLSQAMKRNMEKEAGRGADKGIDKGIDKGADMALEMEEMSGEPDAGLGPENLDPEDPGADPEILEEEEDWEDGPEPARPWMMAVIFAGMLVLAVILCAILWRVTHPGDGGQQQDTATESTDLAGQDGAEDGDGRQAPDADAGSDQVSGDGAGDVQAGSDDPDTDAEPAPGGTDTLREGEGNPEGSQTQTSGLGGEGAEASSRPPETDTPGQDPVSGDRSMKFSDVQETVTPKDVINLRSVPSTADAATVVTQVSNGVTLNRTGINEDTGWSRIDYNGQTLYGVSQYLTADLSYKPPVQASNPNRVNTRDGRVIIFADCDDNITPKEYVNLRTEPSTSEGEATVSCQLNSGEVAHRTGYSADSGWSRVEYNGQVLYVVTSMIVVTE